jgi:hypothetical protein
MVAGGPSRGIMDEVENLSFFGTYYTAWEVSRCAVTVSP